MTGVRTITMSMREFDRLKTIQAVADGNLKATTASVRLGLSRRQVDRLVDRYRMDGVAGLVSGRRGQRHHQLSSGLTDLALSIIRDRYPDFGPTLACEKLRERHGIVIGKETVRKLMSEAGLWIPRRLRSPSIYQPRNWRHCVGELIQIDGSDHRWFENRALACALLVFIDDATSRLMRQAKGRVERPTRPCRTGSSRNCGWRAFRPWPRPMRMRPLSWPTITGALPKPRAMTEMRTGRYSMTALFHQDPVTPVLSRV